MNRWLVLPGLFLGLLTAGGQALGQPAAAPRPNVLFIAVDDLRPELGSYGHPMIQSPNIDRLAASGMLFRQAYCQQAVCSPSRTSLLTGRRPDTTGVYDLETHFRKNIPDVVTLPQFFKQQGYHVEGMGKIFHSSLNDPPSWSVPWRDGPKPHNAWLDPASIARIEVLQAKGIKGNALRGPAFEHPDVPDNAYLDGQIAEMAVETMDRLAGSDQPFFLAVGFIRPHLPFNAPQRYWDLYDHAKVPLADNPEMPRNATPYSGTTWGEIGSYDGIPKQGPIDDETARNLVHAYYASVSYADALVGQVLDALERNGLAQNTIVILWGDHGWKLGEHGLWTKHTNFELDCHAPMILRAPGMKTAGQSTSALVEFVDIYPTLCELAGLPLPDGLEGSSAAPLLDDPGRVWKPAAFSQFPRGNVMGYTMKTARYRYTEWQVQKTGEIKARELYDHQLDPAENVNCVDDPAQAAVVAELAAQLHAGWQAARPKP